MKLQERLEKGEKKGRYYLNNKRFKVDRRGEEEEVKGDEKRVIYFVRKMQFFSFGISIGFSFDILFLLLVKL